MSFVSFSSLQCASFAVFRRRCTKNYCDAATGVCKVDVISGCCEADAECKHKDPCQMGKCNNGICTYKPKVCNDNDPCTDDKCENGICKFVPRKCDDGNKCTDDSCDKATGECRSVPKKCDDNNV